MTHYKNILFATSHTIRSQQWHDMPRCHATKKFFPTPNRKASADLLQLDRSGLAVLVSLITGHGELNYFRSKHHPYLSPTCRLCRGADETFFHLIASGPVLTTDREALFGRPSLTPAQLAGAWDADELMTFLSATGVWKLALGALGEDCLFSDSSSHTTITNSSRGQCGPVSVSSDSSS